MVVDPSQLAQVESILKGLVIPRSMKLAVVQSSEAVIIDNPIRAVCKIVP